MKTKKQRAPWVPKIEWIEIPPTATGNEQFQTRDGMLRLIHSTQCNGIAMPPLWILWKYARGHWNKDTEKRGRAVVEKRAQQIIAEYDAADD